jgi:hypothetical protein
MHRLIQSCSFLRHIMERLKRSKSRRNILQALFVFCLVLLCRGPAHCADETMYIVVSPQYGQLMATDLSIAHIRSRRNSAILLSSAQIWPSSHFSRRCSISTARNDLTSPPRIEVERPLFELGNGTGELLMVKAVDKNTGVVVQPHISFFSPEMLFHESVKEPEGLHELIPAAGSIDQRLTETHHMQEEGLALVVKHPNAEVQVVRELLVRILVFPRSLKGTAGHTKSRFCIA